MIKYLRQVHFYLGVFFAPAIIFFSFSGALQTFSLHENHNGLPGIPWVTALSELHKNQRVPETWTTKEPAEKPPTAAPAVSPGPAATAAGADRPGPSAEGARATEGSVKQAQRPGPPKRREKSVPLKVFVAFMATGLILSSILGIYMAFKYSRGRVLIWGLLIAGTALPIALLYM